MRKAGLRIIRSHHPERLADELSQQLNLPAQRVFAKREVIVQGPAMATWLNREIAQKNGVSALIDFVYPRAHVQKLLQQASASHVYDEYSAIRMTWALMQIIDEEGEQLGLPLPADSSPVRRFRNRRIAAKRSERRPRPASATIGRASSIASAAPSPIALINT